jgi:penicillin-binding protein 1C
VPTNFAVALTTFEDQRFRYHPGVDPLALARALWQDLRARRVVSGGSTLDMQVVRLAYGARADGSTGARAAAKIGANSGARSGKHDPVRRNLLQKLREAAGALWLNVRYDKNEILALYAAHAPFGGNVVGLEAAAWRWFGRPAGELGWGEVAALAVLPNAPGLVRPGRTGAAEASFRAKRDGLLAKLWRTGKIDSLTCALARQEPLPGQPLPLPDIAAHLLEGHRRAHPEGGRWRAPLDPGLQVRTQQLLDAHLERLAALQVRNGAAVILELRTGRTLAYVGNGSPALGAGSATASGTGSAGSATALTSGAHNTATRTPSPWVDCASARRSTGSTLKPFLYALMQQSGELLPKQLIADVPTRFGDFRPRNYDGRWRGAVPAQQALAHSLNVPDVRLLHRYGVDRFQRHLQALGMTTVDRAADSYGLSLILGGAEGTLAELTAMYARLGRAALQAEEKGAATGPIDGGTSTGSSASALRTPALRLPFDGGAAWLTLQALLDVVPPPEEQPASQWNAHPPFAWKTGTSWGFRDGWAIGVDTAHAIGVWVGNANGEGRPGLTGTGAAAPLLFQLFAELRPSARFPVPEIRLRPALLCRPTGYLATAACPDTVTQWIHPAGLESAVDPYSRILFTDPSGEQRVTQECALGSSALGFSAPGAAPSAARTASSARGLVGSSLRYQPTPQYRVILPAVMEYFARPWSNTARPLPPWAPGCEPAEEAAEELPLGLVYPEPGTRAMLARDLGDKEPGLVAEVVHRRKEAELQWYLDEQFVGATREQHKLRLAPEPGDHVLVVVDEQGHRVGAKFAVMAPRPESGHFGPGK